MKFPDRVRVINDKYIDKGITKGMVGRIYDVEILYGAFAVLFIDERVKDKEFMSVEENIFKLEDDIYEYIKVEDLELVEDEGWGDEDLRKSLICGRKDWWCKVENGYILDLKGDKKNKIPYDYNS